MTAELVTSSHNPRIKLVRRLADRTGRRKEGAFAVDGEDLVAAGIAAGHRPRFLLVDSERGLPDGAPWEGLRCTVVPVEPPVLAITSSLAHAARVVGVFEIPPPHRGVFEPLDAPVVYLDGVQDPGNVGTALRSAAAFDAAGLVIGPDTADPLGSKAVRASMGAVFTVEWRRANSVTEIAGDRPIVALDAGGGRTINQVQLAGNVAPVLCIGAEREGLSEDVRTAAEVVASIPIGDGAESLNAAMACTVALYESRRGTR